MSSKLLVVSSAFFFYLVIIFSVLAFCRVWAVFSKHLLSLGISIIGTQLIATPPPPLSVPSLFTVTCSVRDGACFLPLCLGAYGYVARICKPWECSPPWSWFPLVEAPGYLSHPTSTLRHSC